jgi:hypothetical protein
LQTCFAYYIGFCAIFVVTPHFLAVPWLILFNP